MKEPKELAFEFEDVSLKEATMLAVAGGGLYSGIVIEVSKRIPEIERFNRENPGVEEKTIRFGPPGKEAIDRRTAKFIQSAVNSSLKRQGSDWRARYIEKAGAFVCVPIIKKSPNGKVEAEIPGGKKKRITSSPKDPAYIALKEKVAAMVKKGERATEISQKLGERYSRIAALVARARKESK